MAKRSRSLDALPAAFVAIFVLVASSKALAGYKVLIAYDMEGVTGSVERGDYTAGHASYPKVRQSLVEDVNAAIRGLQKAGATDIVLTDCHASGNVEPDYPGEQTPKGARHDIREHAYDPYVEAMDGTFDALVMIGMHTRSGTEGFAPHTYFGNTRWWLNGLEMSETSIVVLSAARFRIPLILVAGDDVHQGEVREFSNAEYVVVKKSLSPRQAESRPREVVSSEIEAAAERALRNLTDYKPYDLSTPIVSRFGFSRPENVAIALSYPGTTLVDDRTVSFITDDYLQAHLAYRTISIILYLTGANSLVQALEKIDGGPELLEKARAMRPPRSWEPTGEPVDTADVNKLGTHGYQ